MKLSIGHRLFASVLLAILAVTACGVALMQYKVQDSFSDYALRIELDRLGELADALTARYDSTRDWRFLPPDARERTRWIAREMLRLQQQRATQAATDAAAMQAASAMQAARAASMKAAAAARQATPATAQTATRARPAAQLDPLPAIAPVAPAAPAVEPVPPMPPVPPVAPVAPLAPLPPLPAPPMAPLPPDETPAAIDLVPPLDALALQDRVTLQDADGAYLAGRRGDAPGERRALSVGGRTVGYLFVARAARPNDAMASAFLAQLKASLLPIVALSVLLSAVAAMLLAAHFRKPILRLADGAGALANGRFDTRLDDSRSDELGELARRFNQLAQHLAATETSRRQWVADTSHELRTPLSVLRAQLEAIQDGVRDASADTVASMLRQVLSLNQLIDDLYALARADLGAPGYLHQPVDAWALASDQALAFAQKFSAAGLRLTVDPAPAAGSPTMVDLAPSAGAQSTVDLASATTSQLTAAGGSVGGIVLGDAERLRQLFANLFENCVRYGGSGGQVALSASTQGTLLVIDIDDAGPGVPDEVLARLGERFFRVEASRSRAHGGAGLGLALCRRIVEAHGGAIAFTRSPLGGLRVRLSFPLAAS